MANEKSPTPADVCSREERLRLLFSTGQRFAILCAIRDVKLPNSWLAGGAVRNTVWQALYKDECRLGIKDFDIAFFDKNTDRQYEHAVRDALQTQFPEHMFDVKNQASFGVWRDGHFVFSSAEDGIAHWLHTATAVGVRANARNEIEIFSPYGLDDLFAGVIRPTPEQKGRPAAEAKRDQFLSLCPALTAVDA